MHPSNYFYRWVILFACFLLSAVASSIVNTVHSLFITPITQELNFSISGFSLIFTISAVVAGVVSPIVGKLLNMIPIRWIMTVSALLVGCGFICYSFAGNIILFYFIAAFVAVGMAGLTTIPISTMITNWFVEARGTAIGFAFAGAGMGTFLWMQIVSKIIDRYGYHYAYLLLGMVILILTVPVSLFLVSKSPEEKYKLKKDRTTGEVKEQISQDKKSLSDLMRNPAFFPFATGLLLMGISVSGVQIHIQPYLASLGYSIAYSANVGSMLAISGLVGNIVGGAVFDKLGARPALYIFGFCALLGLLALLTARFEFIPYLFAVIYGLCLCLPAIWPAYGVGLIFHDADYSTTLGTMSLFFIIGGACGPFFSGVMADSAFGYQSAWAIYFILTGAYLFLFFKALQNSVTQKEGN